MTPPAAPRRRLPQTFRLRLSLLYGALFLAAGTALLAITYGLVAGTLPQPAGPTLTKSQEVAAAAVCKAKPSSVTTPGEKPVPVALPGSCKKVFAAGANAAAASQRDQTLRNLLLYSLLGLATMTIAAAGAGWLMAGRMLRPLRSITAAARRASEGHLGERLALQGPHDELRELADTFDAMLDRLDAAFGAQRRFIADASHELRTPLTVMRTAIDVTLAKPNRTPEQLEAMAVKVRGSVNQADALIDALLTLAASERTPATVEPVDLATLVEDALDTAEPEMQRLGLRVTTDLGAAITHGDRLLLERLVGNLVDNATRHNRPDGWIHVTTRPDVDGVRLTVANGGPVIADDDVEALFEPFRRVEVRTNLRDGVGLGLALVRSIATAHGAAVEAEALGEGGLAVTVTFRRPGASGGGEPNDDPSEAKTPADPRPGRV